MESKILTTKLSLSQKAILIAIGILSILVNMDYSATNLILITISKQFHTQLVYTQWVLSIYIIIWGVLSIPSGKLADVIGYKKAILIGSSLFLTASIFASLADNIICLIIARAFQAIGAALFFPAMYGIIGIVYVNEEQRGKAFGILCATTGVGLIAGPSIMGLFLKYLSWPWIFYINIPSIALVLYIFTTQYHTITNNKNLDIPIIPLFLFIISIATFFLSLNQFSYFLHEKNGLIYFFLLLVIAIALFIVHYFLLQKSKLTLINFNFFKNIEFTSSILIQYIYQFSFASISLLFAIYMQSIEKYSAYQTSLYFLLLTAPFAILSYYGGKLTAVISIKKLCFVSIVLVLLSLLCFSNLPNIHSVLLMIIALLLMGTALGIGFPAMNTLMVSSVDKEMLGEGSGIFMMLSLLFNSLGLVVSMAIFELSTSISKAFYITLVIILTTVVLLQIVQHLKKSYVISR